MEQKYLTLTENWKTLKAVGYTPKSGIVDMTLVADVVTKVRNFVWAIEECQHEDTKGKAKVLAANKLAHTVETALGKMVPQERFEPSDFCTTFMDRLFEVGSVKAAWSRGERMRNEKRAETHVTYETIIEEAALLAGGMKDKTSWKAELTEDSTKEEVLEKGKSLTSGPGQQVLQIKDKLAEARPAAIGHMG